MIAARIISLAVLAALLGALLALSARLGILRDMLKALVFALGYLTIVFGIGALCMTAFSGHWPWEW